MSTLERNKGTLIETVYKSWEEVFKSVLPELFDETEEWFYHEVLEEHGHNYVQIAGIFYLVEYEIKGETDVFSIANVVCHDSEHKYYSFETLHHNSCGWEEFIEKELERVRKES